MQLIKRNICELLYYAESLLRCKWKEIVARAARGCGRITEVSDHSRLRRHCLSMSILLTVLYCRIEHTIPRMTLGYYNHCRRFSTQTTARNKPNRNPTTISPGRTITLTGIATPNIVVNKRPHSLRVSITSVGYSTLLSSFIHMLWSLC